MRVFRNFKKRDWMYVGICVCLVVVQVWLELTMPDYTQKLAEAASSGVIDMTKVWQNGGMMILCAMGSMAAAMFCGFFAAQVAANFAMTLRGRLFDRITDFGSSEINRFGTPSLITRTTNDVVQMQMLIAMGLQVMVKAPIMAVWAVSKISNTSLEWTAAALITVAVILVVVGTLVAVCYPRFKKIQQLTDDLNRVTRENITGVRVVRAFNAEGFQQEKFEEVNNTMMRIHLFTSRCMGLMMPVMTVCMNGLTLAIYCIGAVLINEAAMMDKAVLFGDMTAFTQYALQIVMSFMMLVAIFIILPRAMVSARRIQEVLDTESSIQYPDRQLDGEDTTDQKGEENPGEKRGRLEFRHVSFAYQDAAKPCLHDISFTVEPGETFAIIGATGSGKSSVINLIPRFYDVTEGQVLIDGRDVREYTRAQVEQMVSIAPQKAILFAGDIKSNVTYGNNNEIEETDPELAKALDVAQADFVSDLEEGVHAKVAQGGTNFSGGQKQRLSIARAVYRQAEITIFDDTFSALDYKTDMLVRKGLHEKYSDRTVILVAQRIGTIKQADKIMVLEDGRIAGIGTHEELMRNCKVYKEIALSQLSKEEL